MHAWLFVLAVLATLQPLVQVASTEEVKSSSSIIESSISEDKNRDKPNPETLVQIEKNLLSLFGFNKRPKVDRSKVVIPEAMKQLYAEIMGHELESVNLPKPGLLTKSANTVRSFTHEESKIDERFLHHHRFRMYFNVSSIPQDELLKAAELTLNRKSFDKKGNIRHQILVYDIVRPGIKGKREPIFLLIDTKTVRINSTGTISLDVKPAVQRWLKTPKKNYGILVHISSHKTKEAPEHQHVRLRRSTDETPEKWAHSQPLLFTYTDDGRYKRDTTRSRRTGTTEKRKVHRRKDGREMCHRKPLYVDFSDVGWNDWIVAPPGYDAYYCYGECHFPLADHLNSTNHAVVQTLVHSYSPKTAPKACCVPTQLTSMSMLYLDDLNKVVLKNYQDMTVVGCGCR